MMIAPHPYPPLPVSDHPVYMLDSYVLQPCTVYELPQLQFPHPTLIPRDWPLDGAIAVKKETVMARKAITDRGVTMIPLPDWGRTQDWRMEKKRKKENVMAQG